MPSSATEGAILARLITLARPVCQAAQRRSARAGRGSPPSYRDWQIALLILIAVAARRKSKSAQYRFLWHRRAELATQLSLTRFPARSTYFDRYGRAYATILHAVELQGQRAIAEEVVDPSLVAVDKSLLAAAGPAWPSSPPQKSA